MVTPPTQRTINEELTKLRRNIRNILHLHCVSQERRHEVKSDYIGVHTWVYVESTCRVEVGRVPPS
jgi:hypothetical protein